MKIKSLCFVLFIATSTIINAQSEKLKISPDINMPKDSLETEALLSSVNSFLIAAQNDSPNKWILPTEKIETQLLIDEIIDIQKSKQPESDSFYKGYLTNITPLENSNYTIHISYIGTDIGSAKLRANFELLAHKSGDSYLISSPLLRKTKNWKTKTIQNHVFHYPFEIDSEKVQQFAELTSFYDEKLKNNDKESHYYMCTDEMDPLKLFGVEYKSDYNGWELNNSWESSTKEKNLFVLNASSLYGFDTHDLWHNRLNQVIARKKVHHRVNCHIAYLHGGSWGFSWEELFPLFIENFVIGQNVDWLEHKQNKSHLLTDGHKNYTDDFIGALIVQKIEKEKGFEGVWELLLTKRTKADEEYFAVTKKLIGISKKNYNKEASKLIEKEMIARQLKLVD